MKGITGLEMGTFGEDKALYKKRKYIKKHPRFFQKSGVFLSLSMSSLFIGF
jgi:hypothetical protein